MQCMGINGCPLSQPLTTTWLNINNHVCNAWETMDSRYRNPEPQRG